MQEPWSKFGNPLRRPVNFAIYTKELGQDDFVVKMVSLLFVLYNCALYCSIYLTCDVDIQTIKIGCDRI